MAFWTRVARGAAAATQSVAALLAAALMAVVATSQASAQHTVRPGQSLSRIAARHHVDVWDLALANRMRPTDVLRPGQTLVIPPQGITYVRPGQTLSHVAADHHTTVEELARLNRLRRGQIRIGQRLVLPGFRDEEEDSARDWGPPPERGMVRLRRRDEVRQVRLVDAEGRVTLEALETLADLMRADEGDAPALPHPRLPLMLAAVSDHFGGREIALVSGRREAGGYTRESSRHTSGQATDVRVAGVSRRALWDFCRTLANTGCGYYPRSTFVHLDVRAQPAQWVDWSSPGDAARYGNLREPWPRLCNARRRRAHPRCAREGRSVERRDAVPLEPLLTEEARARMPTPPSLEADEGSPPEDEPEPT